MITLTTPPQVNSVLGGNAPIAYNRLTLGQITFDPSGTVISANLSLVASGSPDMQPITGKLTIDTNILKLSVEVPQIDFYRRVTLTGPQNTSVVNIINATRNSIESGLISLGVIAGTQS